MAYSASDNMTSPISRVSKKYASQIQEEAKSWVSSRT